MDTNNSLRTGIRNQHIVLRNLAETGSNGQNAEAILRELRKLWKIIMDTKFEFVEPEVCDSIANLGGSHIGSGVSLDLRRVTALERYFRSRGKGFLPYLGYHKGDLIFLRRQENLDHILKLYELIDNISRLTLGGLENH